MVFSLPNCSLSMVFSLPNYQSGNIRWVKRYEISSSIYLGKKRLNKESLPSIRGYLLAYGLDHDSNVSV
uniref:Uncharacterized protein n=1 Tax=Picea glauca TaxID=3330 RepID=A0A101M5E3_PICGL|nr:hypothetical protein ABT39_MTgene1287 [Picea glauca]